MNKLEYCITTIPDKIIVNKVIHTNATHNRVILDENMSYQFGIAPLIKKEVGINNEIEIELVPIERLKEQDKEIERLNNIINKGIEAINVYQNEKTLSVGYQDLKRIRGILQGNQFDLERFEEYLQELKGSNDNEENNQ